MEGKKFRKRKEYPLSNSTDTILIEESQEADLLKQTIVTTLRYSRIDKKRVTVATRNHGGKQDIYFDMRRYLLYRCGFEVESLVRTYTNDPVTTHSQLIFQVRLAR